MSYKSTDIRTGANAATPSTAPSFRAADLSLFQSMVEDFAPDWSVELVGHCVEQTSLVMVPETGEDRIGPSFAVTREPCGFKLDKIRWDIVTEIGLFQSLPELLNAIRTQLAHPSSATVTIH
jgi:hypothetical protein